MGVSAALSFMVSLLNEIMAQMFDSPGKKSDGSQLPQQPESVSHT